MTHGLRVTSGVEFGGLELPPDYRRIRNMVPFAKRVMPQVEEREMLIWMGFRRQRRTSNHGECRVLKAFSSRRVDRISA